MSTNPFPTPPISQANATRIPEDRFAEQAVLGAMMLSKDAIANVIEIVRGPDFYTAIHEMIYDSIIDLYGQGSGIDALLVATNLEKHGKLSMIPDGAAYLAEISQSAPVLANAAYYAQIVRDKAVLRRLLGAATKISQRATEAQGDVDDIVDLCQQDLFEVSEKRASEGYQVLGELIPGVIDEIEAANSRDGQMVGVPTGFIELDRLTNGLQPGQMVIIAARPAMGKSTLGLDFCRAAAVHHHLPTAFFSLEMSKSEIVSRLLSAESDVELSHLRGRMSDDDWDRVVRRISKISEAPLYIDDSANLTMMEIRAKARRLKQRNDLQLIVIDYLQLMSSGKAVESRQVEVSEFSRQVKLLAKELNIPIIALSQLNRGPEQRSDKKPMLSDLRESGSLEQDADIVILLNRGMPDRDGEADLIVAKHRNGRTDTIPVAFQGNYSRFTNMQL